jgi:hypothetical protein
MSRAKPAFWLVKITSRAELARYLNKSERAELARYPAPIVGHLLWPLSFNLDPKIIHLALPHSSPTTTKTFIQYSVG